MTKQRKPCICSMSITTIRSRSTTIVLLLLLLLLLSLFFHEVVSAPAATQTTTIKSIPSTSSFGSSSFCCGSCGGGRHSKSSRCSNRQKSQYNHHHRHHDRLFLLSNNKNNNKPFDMSSFFHQQSTTTRRTMIKIPTLILNQQQPVSSFISSSSSMSASRKFSVSPLFGLILSSIQRGGGGGDQHHHDDNDTTISTTTTDQKLSTKDESSSSSSGTTTTATPLLSNNTSGSPIITEKTSKKTSDESATSSMVPSNHVTTATGSSDPSSKNDTIIVLPPYLAYDPAVYDAGGISVEELVRDLQTSPNNGLRTIDEVVVRVQQYGKNVLEQPPSKTLVQLILEQFEDRLVQILVAVAFLSAIFSFVEYYQHHHTIPIPTTLSQVSSLLQDGVVEDLLSAATTAAAGVADVVVDATPPLWKFFVEPVVIVLILFMNAVVGVIQSLSASNSLQALQQLQADVGCVVRDMGIIYDNIPASELVPGDIVIIKTGDKIPADGRLLSISTAVLTVDETSLTGESKSVTKLPGNEGTVKSTMVVQHDTNQTIHQPAPVQFQKGLLFAGTVVTRGTGRMIVTATGMDTQFGRIQKGVVTAQLEQQGKTSSGSGSTTITTTSSNSKLTPLQIKLNEFANTLTYIISGICVLVWCVSIPKMNDPSFGSGDGSGNWYYGALYYAKVAVALGVAAIPEGLPAVITLCLSLGTRRLASNNVIVRKLPSVETLGCTTVICTDKTGTLTTNEMTVVSLILFEKVVGGTTTTSTTTTKVVEHIVEGTSYSPIGHIDTIPYHEEVRNLPTGSVAEVAAVAALCNDAKIIGHDYNKETTTNMKDVNGKVYERIGEPTEAALCVLAEKLGGLVEHVANDTYQSLDEYGLHYNIPSSVLACAQVNAWRNLYPRLATLEFNRDRKSMSVICYENTNHPYHQKQHQQQYDGSGSGGPTKKKSKYRNKLYVKGAPNLLLERCTHIKLRDGTVMKLTSTVRQMIQEQVQQLSSRPLRCIALAVKENEYLEDSLRKLKPPLNNNVDDDSTTGITSNDSQLDISKHPLLSDSNNYRNIESNLVLVGIVGIKDPARPNVASSIEECTKAGIRIIMITGDAKDTAVAIAKDVHIFPKDNENDDKNGVIKAYEGREFFQKTNQEQLDILKEGNIVFCRAEPADKQKLIKILQTSLNEIPAMTGDGVNDAPALQQAAIGVAMGITGTAVAKEAADMILTDDNFATIVTAVREGRRIYANMQAFICFLISCNIGEICAIFFATVAGFPEPLTAMHLLWVNLVTDGPPATALGFNPASPDIMTVPPRPTNEPIMTKWLLIRYCVTGAYVGLATIGVFAQHYLSQGITLAQLASWSQCGEFWTPPGGGVNVCNALFRGDGRLLPQTLALTTLVCMEMIKALCAVSVDNSIFIVGPNQNPWLLLGVAGPFLLHLFVVYSSSSWFNLPALGESLGLVPLTFEHWISVLCWAVPILFVDEILKAIGRYIYREERAQRALALEKIAKDADIDAVKKIKQ